MMVQTRFVATERIADIRRLKDLVSNLEESKLQNDFFKNKSKQNKTLRTLYSTFVIMHYSLLEAVVTIAVGEVMDEIIKDRKGMKHCSDGFLKFLIRCRVKELQKVDFSSWTEVIQNLIDDIQHLETKSLATEEQIRSLWSGNLDAKKIREQILEKWGLELDVSKRSRGGADLKKIKDDRNDLAHGIRSWSEVGSDYTWENLRKSSNRILIYMIRLIKCLEQGVNEKFWRSKESKIKFDWVNGHNLKVYQTDNI